MRTVRIYGSSRNLQETPARTPDVEVWLANNTTTVLLRHPPAIHEWTRWFNLHARQWMTSTYPSAYHYYQTKAAGRPIYFQKAQPDVPTSVAFPRRAIQEAFAIDGQLNSYFTCSVCWLIAFAILEGFERIELWGFELRDTKPGSAYAYERPCVAYWVQMAKDRGIEVFYQDALTQLYAAGKMIPGDPVSYAGPLYGYETRSEPDWDIERHCFTHEDR